MKPVPDFVFGLLPCLATAAILACGGGGGGAGASSSAFAGAWQGSWQDSGLAPSGTLSLDLSQTGSQVTGTASFQDHPCMTTCNVAWHASGWSCSGTFDAGSFQVDFDGGCGGMEHGTLTGHYSVHGGGCDGHTGTITLTRPAFVEDPSGSGVRRVGEVILVQPQNGELVRLPIIEPRAR